MEKPNLFNFATSELSQDAFICWLLSWAKPEYRNTDSKLNDCATKLLQAFFKKHDRKFPAIIESVEIAKQDNNIDVLCVVNGIYPVLIEDKTHTEQSSDQLPRYYATVLGRGYDPENILPIYFKTGDQSDYGPVEDAGYKPFLRGDLLAVLNAYEDVHSEIFQDYRVRMNSIEESVQSFKTQPLNKWSWDSWIGFYMALKKELGGGDWGYVANPSGGFLGFRFSGHNNAYLQLEKKREEPGNLCFKIEVLERERQTADRWAWHAAFMEASKNTEFSLKKPDRFGKGTYMTVCVLDEEYRKTNNEVLDMQGTVQKIQKISDFMKTVSLEVDEDEQEIEIVCSPTIVIGDENGDI